MLKKLVIYGNGQYGRMLYQWIAHDQAFEIAAFTAEAQFIKNTTLLGLPVVPFETVDVEYPPAEYDMMTAIGVTRNRDRKLMFEKAKAKGYYLPNYIGKRAITYADLVLGENNWIANGVYLDVGGRLGDNNTIMANCCVGADFRIGNHNYLSGGCNIGGRCRMGDLCYIGIGATTIQNLSIADEVMVAAGSLLLCDTKPYCKYFGHPARKTGEHRETGIVFHHPEWTKPERMYGGS